MQASVYRLRHKTDGGSSARDTRRDLAASLVWYENNYKALNLITTALGRNVYDRVAHL
jgi:hypothetical protein